MGNCTPQYRCRVRCTIFRVFWCTIRFWLYATPVAACCLTLLSRGKYHSTRPPCYSYGFAVLAERTLVWPFTGKFLFTAVLASLLGATDNQLCASLLSFPACTCNVCELWFFRGCYGLCLALLVACCTIMPARNLCY